MYDTPLRSHLFKPLHPEGLWPQAAFSGEHECNNWEQNRLPQRILVLTSTNGNFCDTCLNKYYDFKTSPHLLVRRLLESGVISRHWVPWFRAENARCISKVFRCFLHRVSHELKISYSYVWYCKIYDRLLILIYTLQAIIQTSLVLKFLPNSFCNINKTYLDSDNIWNMFYGNQTIIN